jgi:O-antigen/teichoic acid export membrane protein
MEDSLRKRYLFKLATNFVGLAIALVTQTIIPRALGPAAYGNFNFLTDFFRQVVGFFDAGTSLGFYTKLSQRLHESSLIRFYWIFAGLVSVTVLLLVQIISAAGLEGTVWPEQEIRFIWMAAVWALLTWYLQIANNIVDAYGLTVGGEAARIGQKILGVILILLMFWLNRFSLTEFFIYNYVILILLFFTWWRILRANAIQLIPQVKLAVLVVKSYIGEFYQYAAPLFTMALFVLLYGVLDRWLLQKIAGSVEQGFYGLSNQIGAICFVFTSAMTVLLMREFSKAYGNQDMGRMRALFRRYVPMLYSIAAVFGMFVAVQADKVSIIFGGSKFRAAAVPIAIMALYPIHQTYGQLTASVIYATGQTKIYRNVAIGIGLLGLPITFWLVGPKNWLGLDLGATGLALKTVLVNLVSVNLLLWYTTRIIKVSFWKFLWHQVYSLAVLGGMAILATIVAGQLTQNTTLAFLTAGCTYMLGCVGITFLFPQVFGTTRAELVDLLTRVWTRIGSIRGI